MLQRSRGLFITFEGGEGGGKSTVLNHLVSTFQAQGYPLIKTREPGGTPLSEEIRALLLDKEKVGRRAELFLFLAARAQHVEELILPSLNEGKIVFCDRFHDSSIAYQGIARGLGEERVREISYFAASHLIPDATLLFDIDPRVGLQRTLGIGKFDRIENEKLSFHETVRKAYLDLAKKEKDSFIIIDASKSQTEVIYHAMLAIKDVFTKFSIKTC